MITGVHDSKVVARLSRVRVSMQSRETKESERIWPLSDVIRWNSKREFYIARTIPGNQAIRYTRVLAELNILVSSFFFFFFLFFLSFNVSRCVRTSGLASRIFFFFFLIAQFLRSRTLEPPDVLISNLRTELWNFPKIRNEKGVSYSVVTFDLRLRGVQYILLHAR